MKILKSWLKDYYPQDISDKRLEEILMLSGLEVESIEKSLDDKVIVVKIENISKHPNADKLRLTTVTNGSELIKVVCGAPNIEVGQIVPLALPGSIIKGQELKAAIIRGEESFGMLCSEEELGIGDDKSGIKILPNEYEIGRSLNENLESDTIYELSVTANRGDCLSHIGVAREIAAFENSSVKKEPISLKKSDALHTSTEVTVKIQDSELCPQYFARVIKGVKVGPSPAWLQDRLIACGAKPINNVVDVTNYILLDLGHPMHAFDQSKISNKQIIVRKAKKNEDIVTLDGEIRNLDDNMLVIADKEKPVAIAGIMGGKNSEVDQDTEVVVLEAAEFEAKNIRATSKVLKLSTEASYRFERGVDSGGVEYAINKAANMIAEIAGGRVMSGIVSAGEKPERKMLGLPHDLICKMLGEDIASEEVDHILRLLGFSVSDNKCQAPFWRHDIKIWQDLAEEIGKVRGYDKIKPLPLSKIEKFKKSNYYRVESIKDLLLNLGYSETMNYPFLSDKETSNAGLDPNTLLEILNPLQPENKYLRNSLIPGILKNIAKNSAFDEIRIFEVGKIFSKSKEEQSLCIASTEKDSETFISNTESIANNFKIDKKLIKVIEFQREKLLAYKIKRSHLFVAEVNLSKAFENKIVAQDIKISSYESQGLYRGVSKFPSLTRDLAFVVDKKISSSTISAMIYSQSDLVNRVELFDEFSSSKLGADKKSLAFHVSLQAFDRTLKDEDANEIIKGIIATANKNFGAKLRS